MPRARRRQRHRSGRIGRSRSRAMPPARSARIGDLAAVRTLGFRGEALPSIASVSRMRMISRPAARHVRARRDRRRRRRSARPRPTRTRRAPTVEVRDLFFNVPARRKFLRAERTELSASGAARRAARADAGSTQAFACRRARRVLAEHRTGARRTRSRRCAWPRSWATISSRNAMKLDHAGVGHAPARLVLPADLRAQPGRPAVFFLNGRPLRDKLIAAPCGSLIATCCSTGGSRRTCCISRWTRRGST